MEHITLEEKQKLVSTQGATLNGKPAGIRGYANNFATVCQIPDGLAYEYAWATVKHIVNNNNATFKA